MTSKFPWGSWSDPAEDPDQFVYHYTTRDAALGSILPTGQIRLGLYRSMNDPRESKEWRFVPEELRFGPRELDAIDRKIEEELARISTRANEIAKDTTKIFCVSRDAEHSVSSPDERYERGYSHSSMWTHYAGRHSGLCLIFDRAALNEAIESTLDPKNLFSGRVYYEDWTPELQRALEVEHSYFAEHGEDRTLKAHIRAYHQELFFHKNRDWSHENEYRWVYFGSSPIPEFVPFGDSLVGICASQDYPDKHDRSLLFLAERYGIDYIPLLYWSDLRVKRIPPMGIVPKDYKPTGGLYADVIMVPRGPRRPLDFDF